jgi:hypothetical protein
VLLHACEAHAELVGEVGDGGIGTPELLQNATSGGVRKRGEGGIQVGALILNHVVHYIARLGDVQAQGPHDLKRVAAAQPLGLNGLAVQY